MRDVVVALSNVVKSFNSVVAVNDVSFSVQRGETFGLLGPNGAGKTTLIRMIMDILRPDSGTVEVLGHRMEAKDKRLIGYLPEERGLYARQKVLSMLEYLALLRGLSREQGRSSALSWLERLGMLEVRDKKISELSKGNQQKVQLIATLVADPEIIILDEPFSGLDPINMRTVSNLMRELVAAGKTIFLSAHQMSVVETLCQRVFMINRGKGVLYGEIDEIKKQYSDNAVLVKSTADYDRCSLVSKHISHNGSRKVYLNNGGDQRNFLAWLVSVGADVESFERSTTPLEDIFIKVVEEKA